MFKFDILRRLGLRDVLLFKYGQAHEDKNDFPRISLYITMKVVFEDKNASI